MSTKDRILERLSRGNTTLEEPSKPTEPSFEGFEGTPPVRNEKSTDSFLLKIDPVSLSERIGLKYEQEIPDTLAVRGDHPEDTEKTLGKPCFIYRDHVLAWEKDPPITKAYAWSLVHLHPGKPLPVEVEDMAGSLSLTPREVRDALFRLAKDGDLERTTQRGGRDLYRLIVRY